MITRDEIERIAALGHIELSEDERERMSGELSRILEHVDQLREMPGVDDGAAGGPRVEPVMREDLPADSLPIEEVERNAPRFLHGHFVVPKVIGE